MTVVTTVVGIPGLWRSRAEIIAPLIEQHGLIFAGTVLMDARTREVVLEVELLRQVERDAGG